METRKIDVKFKTKTIFLGIFYMASMSILAQKTQHNLTKKGLAVEGYDVVMYFKEGKAIEGNKKHLATYNGAKYQFSSEENRVLFVKPPEKLQKKADKNWANIKD